MKETFAFGLSSFEFGIVIYLLGVIILTPLTIYVAHKSGDLKRENRRKIIFFCLLSWIGLATFANAAYVWDRDRKAIAKRFPRQ